MKGMLRLAAVAAVVAVAICAQGALTHTHTYAEEHVHSGQWTVTIPPTCVDYGERTLVCDECGEQVTEPVPKLEHDGAGECVVPADCRNKGEDAYRCNFCGAVVDRRYYPLGEHEFYWHVEVEPTCFNGGVMVYTCKLCGTFDDEYQSREIAALGHSYEKTDEVAPKLFDKGEITYTCTVCGSVTRQELSSYSWVFWLSMVGVVVFLTGLINYFRALKHC